uniref:Uncharacterized protein n=1 Tax=Arundo donax TaxID=35708 RepID=A0A0A9ETK3_ARUDO
MLEYVNLTHTLISLCTLRLMFAHPHGAYRLLCILPNKYCYS